MFSKKSDKAMSDDYAVKIKKLKDVLAGCDAVVIGAGAGLSTAAGLLYSGERFERLFADFIEKYHFTDMYTAAFYQHETLREHWGYWCRHIYHNRYHAQLNNVYPELLSLVRDKDYFVITTNVDHLFRLNGFEKQRIFYTQGDYGLFQCSVPCHKKTYDNEKIVHEMVEKEVNLQIPQELVPYCPVCKEPMVVNVRKDGTFVEDEGWNKAADRYERFIRKHRGKNVVYLELGVGYNTPSIIKYPFWQMTYQNKNATYVCVNADDVYVPDEIKDRSICIKESIKNCLEDL